MCSIPGLPTPGSEVPVLITRVHLNPNYGLVELWVKMDDGRKHIYPQMKEEIQIPQRKFYGPEGQPGDLCLVCISDIWHRARIVSIQSETYNVYLIDQGQPHIATGEALAWGQSDSFLLPPETESCILANVRSLQNEWAVGATKFLMCLPGQKFKGLVHHVLMPDRIILLEISTISKTMCKLGAGKKIGEKEFKVLAQKYLQGLKGGVSSETPCLTQEQNLDASCKLAKFDQYLYPELLTDTFETVTVTEVTDPQNIFCKLLIFTKAVKLLSEQIHQHYEETLDLDEAQPLSCGDPCAARGLDGRWHRSLLRENIVTSDCTVEVFHVDEGKAELVSIGDIRPLLGKFLRMPVVTYLCSLNGIKENRDWTADETDYLKSQLLHQKVVAKFDRCNELQNAYYVTLYADDDACINKVFLKRAGFIESSKPVWDLDVQKETPSSPISVGNKLFMDAHHEINGLPEESAKSQVVNGRSGDTTTSSMNHIDIKASYKVHDPLPCNGHLSAASSSDVPNAYDDNVFAVGKSVNVNVSCIESPKRFWCQTTESGHSLIRLMNDLQNHYSSPHPQPLIESICVARNPDTDSWYRAKIIANQDSPTVDVRFIDYGNTQKVPLKDLRPIDPAFLRLNAQAFQCSLLNLKNPTNPTPVSWTDAVLAEFQDFVDLGNSSDTGLKCVVKAATADKDGLLLNVVDLESASESASKRLAQKCAQPDAQAVPSDAYNHSTHNIEVGGKEKVLVTFSETVGHFYCQLYRDSHVLDKMMKNVATLFEHPQSSDHPLGLNGVCLARYTDHQWYRGQVVHMSPKLKVHFVDYGDTLVVCETDIQALPSEASSIRSVPAQAIPLGLFDVPAELPQEVNEWFADHAVGHTFTISVIAKGENGKLIVKLLDGSLNVNVLVREKVAKMKLQKMTGLTQQKDQQLSNGSERVALTNEDCSIQELVKGTTEQYDVCSTNWMCTTHNASPPATECAMILNGDSKPTLNFKTEAETSIQDSHSDLAITRHSPCSCPEGNGSTLYTWPNISGDILEVYASCIVGPCYFWCQYSNTENLDIVSKLALEAGQEQDAISPEMLKPGSPCLALFSSDNQWYRAQVIRKTDNTLYVLFVDYGNESEVDIDNVRSLPQSLLEMPPLAFLCCLNDFESKGSWDDKVYDDFHNLLIDKQLKVAVFDVETYSEMAVPQYKVKTECDGVVINNIMQKYWIPLSADHLSNEVAQTELLPQDIPTEAKKTDFDASKMNLSPDICRDSEIAKGRTVTVYASCIAEPNFFWCQFANAEDLQKLSQLAQEAGRAQQDNSFLGTLGPGSPCLALFSDDNQWYRALVIKQADSTLHVLFVDYGNESEVDLMNVRPLPQNLLEIPPQAFLCRLNGFDSSNGSWDDDVYDVFHRLLVDKPLKLTMLDVQDHLEIGVPQSSVEMVCEGENVNAALHKYWKPVAEESVMTTSPLRETSLQSDQTEFNIKNHCVPKADSRSYVFKEPIISKNKTEMVYASCIAEPNFFWCQFANTEDLQKLSQLAQEAGQAPQDNSFPETLRLGSPCLALFSSDNQWYRALVLQKADKTLHVLFIDYGNESEVDIMNVRPLPQNLLEIPPQAFLCRLNGFDKSKGSWDEEVYDDLHNLLVDKLFRLTIFDAVEHPEITVPQYAVEMECGGVVVNAMMEKYWKAEDTDGALTERL